VSSNKTTFAKVVPVSPFVYNNDMKMNTIKKIVPILEPTEDKIRLTTFLRPDIYSAILAEASKRRRSRSAMVSLLLEKALKDLGYKFPGINDTIEVDELDDGL
jgi:hypothetical protein